MTKIPKLFELMKLNNITATKLSHEIGVSTGNISDWKHGRCIPSSKTLTSLANYFGVSTDYLLEDSNTSINTEVFISGNCGVAKAESAVQSVNINQNFFSNPAVTEAYGKLSEKSKLEVQIYILDKAENENKKNE